MENSKIKNNWLWKRVKVLGEMLIVLGILLGVCYGIDKKKIFGLAVADDGGDHLIYLYIAIIGISSVYYAYVQTSKHNYNDLITKSRIDWTEKVKDIYIEFIEIAVDQQNKIEKIREDGGLKKIKNKEFKNKFYDNSKKLKSKQNAFEIYFNPEDPKDLEIVQKADDIINYISHHNYKENSPGCFKMKVDDLSITLSKYLKREWEKIKDESR